jgi:prophage antirepressor-like protein
MKNLLIKKFEKSEFGNLTTITNEKTGVTMFIAKEIGEMWGHTNMKQVINRILNESEYKVITKSQFPDIFKLFVSNALLPSKAQRIQLVTESAVYKLALASNLEKAKPFRDWVTSEVIPSIRKKGYYTLADQTKNLMLHTNKDIQKQNSKDINSKNLIENGLDGVIEYNRKNCLVHTGKRPSEIIKNGKELGLKSKDLTSAKQVLRNIMPEVACSMSFVDDLVKNGFDFNTVSELALKSAIPLFKGMIEIGAIPNELKK